MKLGLPVGLDQIKIENKFHIFLHEISALKTFFFMAKGLSHYMLWARLKEVDFFFKTRF